MTKIKTGKQGPKTVQKARPGRKGAVPSAVRPDAQNRVPDSGVNVPTTKNKVAGASQDTSPRHFGGSTGTKA